MKKKSPSTTSVVDAAIDASVDAFEKISTPRTRAGSAIERAGKMQIARVDAEVTALQMTKNSPNGFKYTEEHVLGFAQLYQDSKTRVLITAKQARALIHDQLLDQPLLSDTAIGAS